MAKRVKHRNQNEIGGDTLNDANFSHTRAREDLKRPEIHARTRVGGA